jgi:cytochrome b pre-mRNA-processing protein 6
MKQRLDKHVAGASPGPAADSVKSNAAFLTVAPPSAWDETKEMEQVNALYNLLENKYVQEHPLPPTLRNPASSPTYYDDLMREMQEAPTRSWFGAFVKRIKGSFRLA